MPLAKTIPTLRQELRNILVEDLAAALSALKELLPDTADKHRAVLALQARLKDANKEKIRNTLSPDDYQRRVDTIRAECFDLIDALEEGDFEIAAAPPKAGQPSARQGIVLYRVPQRMPIRKPTICTVRVAIEEDALFEDIVLDDNVRLKQRVEVSDMMKAELLDPEGEVFSIRPLSEAEQLVRETGYTQWLFSVTPRVEGEHQLLVKVSMLEYVSNLGRYVPKEVSILETVTIVTEGPAPSDAEEAPLKSTGESFALGPNEQFQAPSHKSPTASHNAPINSPQSAVLNPPSRSHNKALRAAALFLAFLMLGTATTWAVTPAATIEWWKTSWKDTAEAYAGYIETFKISTDPKTQERVETAWLRKIERTESLADLRQYQREYRQSARRQEVAKTLYKLENRAVDELKTNPESTRFERFVQDFPDGQRFAEVKQLAQAQSAERREILLPLLENAVAKAVQEQPNEGTARNLLTHFPQAAARAEVRQALAEDPELRKALRPQLETALTKNLQQNADEQNARAVLEEFPERHELVEKAVERKPAVKKAVASELLRAKQRAKAPPTTVGSTPVPDAEQERHWQQARATNTVEAYAEFVNRYPQSAHRPEARERVKALKPALTPEAQDWADACLNHTAPDYIYFVRKYPKGLHTAEARQRIKTFSLSKLEQKRLEAAADARLRQEKVAAARQDSDGDGTPDAKDGCPDDKNKTAPGACGCGQLDSDADGDETPDCNDECPNQKGPVERKGCPETGQKTGDKNTSTSSVEKNGGAPRRSGLQMVQVSGGSFLMGSPDSDKDADMYEKPQHRVTLSAFEIGKYEVTQADWRDVMGHTPSSFKNCDQCPVEKVSWDDIQDFLKKLNAKDPGKGYRLPTESEWEYAARGGAKSKGYKYAGGNNLGEVAWYDNNSGNKTHPVGQKAPNELGLYDMSGNVYEWCADSWHKNYKGAPPDGSAWYTGGDGSPVLRGGSWLYNAVRCRSTGRGVRFQFNVNNYVGFRIARD